MIIDPSRDGCTVWFGTSVQFLKGTTHECCKRIIDFVTDENGKQFNVDIVLDTMGIGVDYAQFFNKNDIKFMKVKHKTIIK